MNTNLEKIQDLLFKRFNTSIDVSYENFRYTITPTDNIKLAMELEVEVDSEDYFYDLDKIETAINLLFL